jgi:hypothetical protein
VVLTDEGKSNTYNFTNQCLAIIFSIHTFARSHFISITSNILSSNGNKGDESAQRSQQNRNRNSKAGKNQEKQQIELA